MCYLNNVGLYMIVCTWVVQWHESTEQKKLLFHFFLWIKGGQSQHRSLTFATSEELPVPLRDTYLEKRHKNVSYPYLITNSSRIHVACRSSLLIVVALVVSNYGIPCTMSTRGTTFTLELLQPNSWTILVACPKIVQAGILFVQRPQFYPSDTYVANTVP